MGRLDELDLSQRISSEKYYRRLEAAQQRLLQLRLTLGGHLGDTPKVGPGLLVVMEGRDAGGKGGAIRRIVDALDPRHYRVSVYGKPTDDEKRHHFLWRFYTQIPGHGGMCLFDRSWYGRVLVERIEGFATEEQWSRAYDEIVGFERTLVLEGVILVKFWLHISDDEQLRRFERRQSEPLKRWKLTDEDWRNRKKNRLYDAAAEEMFERTDHDLAPWDLVSGEQKRYGRIALMDQLITRIEEGMERAGMKVPKPLEHR